MNQVEGFDCVASFDNARYIDLTGSLADHFDIDVALSKSGEHPSGNTDHVAHLPADEGEDGHVTVQCDLFPQQKKD